MENWYTLSLISESIRQEKLSNAEWLFQQEINTKKQSTPFYYGMFDEVGKILIKIGLVLRVKFGTI